MPWRCYFGGWKTTLLPFPTHLTPSDYVFSLLTRFLPSQITLCLTLCFHSPFYLSLWALSMFSSFWDGWVSIYTSFLPLHCTSFKAEINTTYFCQFLKMLYSLKEKWVPAPYNPFCPQQPGYFFQKHNWDYAAALPKPSSDFPLHWSQIHPSFRVHKSRMIWPPPALPTCTDHLKLVSAWGPLTGCPLSGLRFLQLSMGLTSSCRSDHTFLATSSERPLWLCLE